ncbi:MAG: methyltransferase domain-containing protein [Candidatus Sabulitectum sp.]|nr:methyltransferase domain-containing protein [Candidatus Sabulitectum sp.]
MKRRTEPPAETQCKRDQLRDIYRRQFEELASLRRHILSRLPLRQINTIFEPGCGTGLLGEELQTLSDAAYTGMDIDPEILPENGMFIAGDTENNPLPADLYVSSFFFSSVDKPVKWLKKAKKNLSPNGLFAVFAEYDYTCIGESPDTGFAEQIREGLEKDGINTTTGSQLDSFFEKTGFRKLAGGEINSSLQKPDRAFLEMHVENIPDVLPLMSWRIVWGIWSS